MFDVFIQLKLKLNEFLGAWMDCFVFLPLGENLVVVVVVVWGEGGDCLPFQVINTFSANSTSYIRPTIIIN